MGQEDFSSQEARAERLREFLQARGTGPFTAREFAGWQRGRRMSVALKARAEEESQRRLAEWLRNQ